MKKPQYDRRKFLGDSSMLAGGVCATVSSAGVLTRAERILASYAHFA